MDAQIEETLNSLGSRHINAIYAENSTEACQKILELIPSEAVVGMGDSTGLRQIGVLQCLKTRGTEILDPFKIGESNTIRKFLRHRENIEKNEKICEFFLAGTNAITRDGRLINVDGLGNRVSGMFWGHPISIIAIGKNKIVEDLDQAFLRIRQIIAPAHFHLMAELGGRKRKIPCSATGKCSDCRSTDRGCNVFTIIEGKPYRTNLNVIIVNQDLGLGWDPSWPQDRISMIIENYKKFVWIQ